jgi:O-antigen/teichoic acid export membrane protein
VSEHLFDDEGDVIHIGSGSWSTSTIRRYPKVGVALAVSRFGDDRPNAGDGGRRRRLRNGATADVAGDTIVKLMSPSGAGIGDDDGGNRSTTRCVSRPRVGAPGVFDHPPRMADADPMTEPAAEGPGPDPLHGSPAPAGHETAPLPRASIRRNIAQMTFAQGVTFALAVVLSVVVPRYLAPESVGTVQLAASLWAIASIVSIGSILYLQLQIASNAPGVRSLVGTVLCIRSGLHLLGAVALAGYVFVTTRDGDGGTLALVIAITGTSVLLSSWAEVYSSAFVGFERMATPARSAIAAKVVTVVGVLTVVELDLGLYGILCVGVMASTLSFGYLLSKFHQLGRTDFSRWRVDWRPVLVASIPFTTVHLANTVYRQTDVIIINNLAGARDVGWYAAGDVLIGTLLFPASIVLASVFPSFGRLYAHDQPSLVDLVGRSFWLLFMAAVPIGFGTALVGPTFAPFLLGEDYAGTGEVLAVMGPVLVLTYGTTLISQVAMATGRGRFWTVLLFAAAAMTIPLDMVLVPWAFDRFDNGAVGGALAYVVTELTQYIVGVVVIVPYLVSVRSLWRAARIVAAGLLMCVAVWPVREMFVLVPAAVGALVYAAAVFVLRVVDDYQRQLIATVLRRLHVRGR